MEIETIVQDHLTSVRMAILSKKKTKKNKKKKNKREQKAASVEEDVQKLESFYTVGENVRR